MAENTGKPWTNDELEAAVFGYMFLLALERNDISYPIAEFYKLIGSGPLSKRNEASIRYRFRNITAVMADLRLPTLAAFSAASQVGNNVKARLSEIILSYSNDPNFDPRALPKPIATVAEDKYRSLLESVESLQAELAEVRISSMVGHNNPPGAIEDQDKLLVTMDRLSESLSALSDLGKDTHLANAELNSKKNAIISITIDLLSWGKNRVTKFIDAALVTAAPILLVTITDMTPKILNILSKIQSLVG